MKRLSALAALVMFARSGMAMAHLGDFMRGIHIKKSGKGKGVFGRFVARSSNKFKRGQSGVGERECSRRIRQMASGMLTASAMGAR